MKARQHYLEIALESAIKANDLETVKNLIKTIQKTSGPSLVNLDEQGRSFLFLALEKGNNDIAKALLSLYEDNDDILFCKNQNKQTLLHMAILKGHYSIATKLVEIAEKKNKFNLYLEEDIEGDTVLHLAAALGKGEMVESLLTKINKQSLAEIINQVNKEGDTALHCAFKVVGCKSIEHLINHGAKLNLNNNKHHTTMMLFANLTQERQVEIFLFLNKERQDCVLQSYKNFLINNNIPEDLKNNYFKLAGSRSLQALLIAHHEFNRNIPVRNSFITTTRKSENKNSNGEYDIMEKEEYIEDTVLRRMPLYARRVEFAEKIINGRTKEKKKNSILVEEETKPIESQSNDEMLDMDRVTLISLIDDIEKYLNNLRGRPIVSTSNRVLSVLIPTVAFLTYVSLEPWFIYKSDHTPYYNPGSYTRNQENRYYSELKFNFGFGFGFGSLFTIFAPVALWNKEPNVSHNEWEPIVAQLKQSLLEKLQDLEERELNSNEKYLPTQPQNIRDLEDQLKRLAEWRPFSSSTNPDVANIKYPAFFSQQISKVIDIFTRLKNIVETIQQDLNLSKKPLSLFFKPPTRVYVGSDSDYDSEDELLPKQVKKKVGYTV